MFTGIVKEIGSVSKIERSKDLCRIDIRSGEVSKGVETGGSVAVNGACLTAVSKVKGVISFDVMTETIDRTTLAGLKKGDAVNLEPSLRVGDPLDGHFVTGHVDHVGSIRDIKKNGDDIAIEIGFDGSCKDRPVRKGSVAIDGVSLTVGGMREDGFTVFLIPHTMKVTTLGMKKAGDRVNIEFDIIGKYVSRSSPGRVSRIDEAFLRENGF